MAVNFNSPSYRAAQGNLAISVSPLGLVELSDEEMDVHGPRLVRYSHHWAFYLGHHWSYQREQGEPQITFNYARAFADYINNFCFGKGVTFSTPAVTEAIIPALLQKVWEVQNNKQEILWTMGQQGGVTGDCFVKVAYEESWKDSIGRIHAPRVRIIVLNSQHCFPEWHPHDRDRLLRFKLKYRFFGTNQAGERQANTYTEVITDDAIQEFVNDRLINERPNPLGMIPVVHIANETVSGSPWGLSDIGDIIPLNREFNEKSTDISDIINYHAAPVTIITGARASNLEKGAKKIWSLPQANAKVHNLESTANLGSHLQYLDKLKQGMHEMTGVPETALGQRQPISNTSGVALAIQFQPMMNVWDRKKLNYGKGIRRINELVILTLAVKEPWSLQFDPTKENELKPGQYPVLDPMDPITYQTTPVWQPPLPTDTLVLLNEIQQLMGLQLESKRGAMRRLGEEFPDEKIAEINEELRMDALDQASLDLLRTELLKMVGSITGVVPSEGNEIQHAGGGGSGDGEGETPGTIMSPDVLTSDVTKRLFEQLVTGAYGTRLAQRRTPSE